MRTTLHLDNEAYGLAKAIADERNVGLGRAISEIILCSAKPENPPLPVKVRKRRGLPVVRVGRVITSEDVSRILDRAE